MRIIAGGKIDFYLTIRFETWSVMFILCSPFFFTCLCLLFQTSLLLGSSYGELDEDSLCLEDDSNVKFSVWVSFCEIYNENIHDLLDFVSNTTHRRNVLRLCQDIKGNTFVKGNEFWRSASVWFLYIYTLYWYLNPVFVYQPVMLHFRKSHPKKCNCNNT